MIKVKFNEWLTEGFHMVKAQLGPWMVVTLVLFLITILTGITLIGLFVVMGILMFGMHNTALQQLRGGEVKVGALTSTFGLIGSGLAFLGIWVAIAIPSLLLLLLPLLFIAPLFMFVPHLIVDQQLGVIAAMKESARVVKQDYWMFFLFNLVVGLLGSLGSYVCYIGILATLPFMYTSMAVAYRDCWQIDGAYSFMPPKPNQG